MVRIWRCCGAVRCRTPDDARRALLAVTREDVRDILKQFTLSVSCLLTREEGNENG